MTPRLALTAVLAVGALAACGGGGDDGAVGGSDPGARAAGPPDAQTATVDSTDKLTFVPSRVDAKVGMLALTLTNTGGIPHNLVFDDKAFPAIGTVTGGQNKQQTYTFTAAGTYDFVCTFHSGMDGQVVVS